MGDGDRDDPLVGKRLGDYRVDRKLSAGGFGAVYAATQIRTGRRYALKILRPDRAIVSPGARERFRREATALSGLGHAGIVAIHDYASDGGIDYIVMDLLEGEDLAQRLAHRGKLPLDEVLQLVEAMTDALQAAHSTGIVHRDLKPGNVFLATTPGEGERPVLLDFGLAKDVSGSAESLTASGEALGTPAYMAPEQASGKTIDARTDVYALAALTYEMLSGSPPFEGGSAASVLLKVITEPPAPLIERVDVPGHVAAAIHRALAKEPEDRFEGALAFRDALLGDGAATYPETRSLRQPRPSEAPETRASQRPAVAARSTRDIAARTAPIGVAVLLLFGAGLAWWLMRDDAQQVPTVNAVPPDLVTEQAMPDQADVQVTDVVVHVAPETPETPETEAPEAPEIAEARRSESMASRMRRARTGAPPSELPAPSPMSSLRVEAPSERATAPSEAELDGARRTELRELEDLLGRVDVVRRSLAALPRGDEPSFCRGNRRLPRNSESPMVVSNAQSLNRLMDRACEPFAAAREPSPEVRQMYRRMGPALDRAQEMARETSSTNQPVAIAREVDAAIDRARAAFEGVEQGRRAFPCDAPVWSELRRLGTSENGWSAAAARRVTQQQSRICGRLGIGRSELRRVGQRAEDDLDDVEGRLRAAVRPLRAGLGSP